MIFYFNLIQCRELTKYIILKKIFFLFSIALASNAYACKFLPGAGDFSNEKLENAKVAFIGKVILSNERYVTFEILHDLKYNTKQSLDNKKIYEVELSGNSCEHNFIPQTEWLFLGTSMLSGSMVLSKEYSYHLKDYRSNIEENLKEKNLWINNANKCYKNDECTSINLSFGKYCQDIIGVNKKNENELKNNILNSKVNNLNLCDGKKEEPKFILPNSYCVNNKCSILGLEESYLKK